MSFSPFSEINNITLLGLFRLAVEKRSKAITDRNQNLRFRTMNTKFTRDLQIFLRKNREMYLAPVNPNAAQAAREQAAQGAATGEPTAKRTRVEPATVNQGASASTAVPPRPFKVPNILKRSMKKRANTIVKPERGTLRK
ncbi:hypothetical protein CRE_30465 [Caenorhabditis remanei]|uniref:Uncharacterized protein n=1 Tax=Caenorhabditis remanei TaxID=31234 RepID=E3NDY4_CAERE|nr:hypothetical protein CRE_30465 [Caenorhabditis remanei]